MSKIADVVIVGGGMVGLTLALALAKHDFQVVILERELMHTNTTSHARVSAVNLAALNFLRNLSVLAEIPTPSLCSLQRLFVWDDLGSGEIEFTSADYGAMELGKIIENQAILQAARKQLQLFPVEYVQKAPVALQQNSTGITVTLEDGLSIQAQVCIGADGTHSWVRSQMQAKPETRSYDQQALIALIKTAHEHQHTAWQVFLPEGPLALLPLANIQHCAMVWSLSPKRAKQFLEMHPLEFDGELNNAFGTRLGELNRVDSLQHFPLQMLHATAYAASGIALVGDAAHTIHPLAGQGVNLGFMDAAALVDCFVAARKKKDALGDLRVLKRYARWRRCHNTEMICAMRFFNDLFTSTSPATVFLRSQGLTLTNRCPWLKNQWMKTALGQTKDLPSLAKPLQ